MQVSEGRLPVSGSAVRHRQQQGEYIKDRRDLDSVLPGRRQINDVTRVTSLFTLHTIHTRTIVCL